MSIYTQSLQKHDLYMNFKTKFQEKFPFLQTADFHAFLNITTLSKYKKGGKVITSGDTKKKAFLVQQGIVRGYIINYQGRELTTFLYKENEAFAAYEPIILNKPTNHTFECLENCELFSFDYQALEDLIKTNKNIKKVRDAILSAILLRAIQRNESFIRESPERRYLSFIKNNSDLLQRVSQKHIASYLGITAVSFSRLKKRIYRQQE